MRGDAVSYCNSYKTLALHSFLLSALIALTPPQIAACPRIIVCERERKDAV